MALHRPMYAVQPARNHAQDTVGAGPLPAHQGCTSLTHCCIKQSMCESANIPGTLQKRGTI